MNFDKQRVYVVNRDDTAAWSALVNICQRGIKPGDVIPLSADEFDALKESVMVLELPGDIGK